MKVNNSIIEILKREGTEFIVGFPGNSLFEAAAEAGLRPIIVRQERTALHIAEGFSRMTSGKRIGVAAMQFGPGVENAFGGVAQAFSDSAPIVVLPTGYRRKMSQVTPNLNAYLNFQHVTKSAEQVIYPAQVEDVMRRAYSQVKNGRPGPVLVEIPIDIENEEVPGTLSYKPALATRSGPDPKAVAEVARVLLNAKNPVVFAGQGVHYAQAWDELVEFAELLQIPVATSLPGKSAFPENHPLSLGCGGRTMPEAVNTFLQKADVILGLGCSFTFTSYNAQMPAGKTIIHATLDPVDLDKDVRADYGLIGDAKLILQALIEAIKKEPAVQKRTNVAAEIKEIKERWLKGWMPKLTDNGQPYSPYRVIWDLLHTVDPKNTIITGDAGSPRDQLCVFWESIDPLTYIGWGKTTQLGTSLGFAMGAKLACPDKLCVAYMGDAAIGMIGMDFETAVREQIPVLVIVSKNAVMTCELSSYPKAKETFGILALGGNYADMAVSFGGYGERVTQAKEIVPAIHRALGKIEQGVPALLECITCPELEQSRFV